MARLRAFPTHVSEHMTVYRRPDPATVALIVDEYSFDAARERWSWLADKTITTMAAEGRRLKAARGPVDTRAMRDCVQCERPFFSKSAANVVCVICKAESRAVFE